MKEMNLLAGKRVLVVDDEPDILEVLKGLLSMCEIFTASSFEEAKELLETKTFDIAILDIMGVNGYELLNIATKKGIIAVMLTAHALSLDDTVKSFQKGAASYIPKDEMANIVVFLKDILEAKEKGKNFWWRWMDRFAAYYDKKFGPDWQQRHKDFWDKYNFYS
ncbi:MAG: response regulator [Euryarchaeota archaeon]|nr:response regulator [Euryarchaeota archaeon]